jgi:hypothetical protein
MKFEQLSYVKAGKRIGLMPGVKTKELPTKSGAGEVFST